MGDNSNVIPHITFNRSTLPWERSIDAKNADHPWLALLVFWESEKPEPQVFTLEKLKTDNTAKFPGWNDEPGEQSEDEVTVIDVPKSLLEKIIPRRADLPYLGHVRQAKDNEGKPTDKEQATFLANRLPKAGETTTVHLVSLENRYPNGALRIQ